jgi:uncharacterized protein
MFTFAGSFFEQTLNSLKVYDIGFSGLKEGIHLFEYQINDKFLALNPSDDLESVKADIGLRLEKQTRMLILNFDIKGEVTVPCDRCLDPLVYPLEGEQRLIVKFGEEAFEETDEIIVLPESEHKINVAQFIYEFIHLLLPIQRTHANDASGESLCDPDMLRRLSPAPEQGLSQSPWDVLKELKNNISNS